MREYTPFFGRVQVSQSLMRESVRTHDDCLRMSPKMKICERARSQTGSAKLALMQPYFFPYIGYFQLIHEVDLFVFFDDVTFIRRGWINRNQILARGVPTYFTIPVRRAGTSKAINKTVVYQEHLPRWKRKFLRTLRESYSGSPNLRRVTDLVEEVLSYGDQHVALLAQRSVIAICELLDLKVDFLLSSRDFPPSAARGVERVIEICRAAGAPNYVNAPGGRSLYDPSRFAQDGLALSFLEPNIENYPQRAEHFFPRLSILDLILNVDLEHARSSVRRGTLS